MQWRGEGSLVGPAGLNVGREGGGMVAKKLQVLNREDWYTTGLWHRDIEASTGRSVLCGSQRQVEGV